MAESNGHTTTVPAWMHPILRSFQAITTRVGLSHRLGSTHEGMRDIEAVLGYKDSLTYRDFKRAYLRNDIARRVVTIWPDITWGAPPIVQDDPAADTPTPFMQAWQDLERRLALYRNLGQLDLLAQLGHYGCLLLGLRGQTDLAQPATPLRSPDDLLFVQPYSEELMRVQTFGTDPADVLYGKPTTYLLLGSGSVESTDYGLRRPVQAGRLVHASRVLHLPGQGGLDDPDIYGLPILEAIYNKLVDLLKVVGGSAEMFWRDAKRRIALEVQEGYTLSPTQADQLTQEAEEYQHGMRDFLRLMGVQAKDLSGTVASPKEHFETLIQCIASTTRIPARVLLGSERGQLASTQDQDEYLRQVNQRQTIYAGPRAVDPLLQKLIDLHILPEPAQPWTLVWPNLWALSEQQQAQVMKDRASAAAATMQAVAAYRGPGMGDTLVSPEEVRALLAPVWQATEMALTPELPPEVEEQLLLSVPTDPSPDGPPADPSASDQPPADPQAA